MSLSGDINGARHVLVVDDDENDVFLLRRAFQKVGLPHTLIHLRDGHEAIRYLSAKPSPNGNHAKPNLLLLDLKMPGLDGFDVLLWLQGWPAPISLPVIVLSSSILPEDMKKAKDLGALDYLTKPADMEGLITLVSVLHHKWLSRV